MAYTGLAELDADAGFEVVMMARLLSSTEENPVWLLRVDLEEPYTRYCYRGFAGSLEFGSLAGRAGHFPYGHDVESDSVVDWTRPDVW